MTDKTCFEGFPHVLRSQQFSPSHLEQLFLLAEQIRTGPEAFQDRLTGAHVLILFSQPSSRTRTSFELSARKLGASEVFVESNAAEFSSAAKGETIEDTILMYLEYGFDWFIIRHQEEGSVGRAAAAAGPDIPVINAGDGTGQHPTQALLDTYTIWREHGGDLNKPLTVGLHGDLRHGRTINSLVYLLSRYPKIKFVFISPEGNTAKRGLIEHLQHLGREFEEHPGVPVGDLAEDLDVLYVTRPQLEYNDQGLNRAEAMQKALVDFQGFIVNRQVVGRMKPGAIIMHPLPRNFELPLEVDTDPRVRYIRGLAEPFGANRQMGNGRWVRMALMVWIQELLTKS